MPGRVSITFEAHTAEAQRAIAQFARGAQDSFDKLRAGDPVLQGVTAKTQALTHAKTTATASLRDFSTQLSAIPGPLGDVAGRVQGLTGFLTGPAGLVIGAVAAGAAMVKLASDLGSSIERLDNLSQQTGLSVKSLQAFEQAARDAGESPDTLVQGLAKINVAVAEVLKGNAKAGDSFRAIGVDLTALVTSGASTEVILEAVATALGGIADPTARAAAQMDIFGVRGRSINAVLQAIQAEGAAGYIRRMQEIGIVTSDATNALGRTMDALQDTWSRKWTAMVNTMQSASAAIVLSLTGELGPALDEINKAKQALTLPSVEGVTIELLRERFAALHKTLAELGGLSTAQRIEELVQRIGPLRHALEQELRSTLSKELAALGGEGQAARIRNIVAELESLQNVIALAQAAPAPKRETLEKAAKDVSALDAALKPLQANFALLTAQFEAGDRDAESFIDQLNQLGLVTHELVATTVEEHTALLRFQMALGDAIAKTPEARQDTSKFSKSLQDLGDDLSNLGPLLRAGEVERWTKAWADFKMPPIEELGDDLSNLDNLLAAGRAQKFKADIDATLPSLEAFSRQMQGGAGHIKDWTPPLSALDQALLDLRNKGLATLQGGLSDLFVSATKGFKDLEEVGRHALDAIIRAIADFLASAAVRALGDLLKSWAKSGSSGSGGGSGGGGSGGSTGDAATGAAVSGIIGAVIDWIFSQTPKIGKEIGTAAAQAMTAGTQGMREVIISSHETGAVYVREIVIASHQTGAEKALDVLGGMGRGAIPGAVALNPGAALIGAVLGGLTKLAQQVAHAIISAITESRQKAAFDKAVQGVAAQANAMNAAYDTAIQGLTNASNAIGASAQAANDMAAAARDAATVHGDLTAAMDAAVAAQDLATGAATATTDAATGMATSAGIMGDAYDTAAAAIGQAGEAFGEAVTAAHGFANQAKDAARAARDIIHDQDAFDVTGPFSPDPFGPGGGGTGPGGQGSGGPGTGGGSAGGGQADPDTGGGGGGAGSPRQHGGWIFGPTLGRDHVRVLADGGEFMVRAGMARRHARTLEAINAGVGGDRGGLTDEERTLWREEIDAIREQTREVRRRRLAGVGAPI